LNIVKRYADLLGGSVTFNSRYGEGSTFSIALPLNISL
jgi:signal transduction histidine kinase